MDSVFALQQRFFKTIFTAIFLGALILMSSCSKDNKIEPQGNKSDNGKKETVNESANPGNFKISYELQGMMNGKMDILKSGTNMKQKINSSIMGVQNTNTIYILNNVVYSLTEAGGQQFATKSDLAEYNSRKSTGETITDLKEFEKFLSGKNVTGNENILGNNCEIYEVGNGMNLSVYNKRYILRIKSPEFMAVATSLDTDPSFAPDEFKLPDNVEYKNSQSKGFDKKSLDSAVQKLKK